MNPKIHHLVSDVLLNSQYRLILISYLEKACNMLASVDFCCYCIGATGKGPQQKTVCVFLEKTPGRDPGFIFHETGYNNSGVRC